MGAPVRHARYRKRDSRHRSRKEERQLSYGILVLLLLASAFFSGTETACFSLDRLQRTRMSGEPRGRRVLKLLSEPGRLLTTILLCNTFVNVGASTIAAGITARLFPGPLGMGVGVLLMTFILLVTGEISPKSVARSRNREWAERAAPVMSVLVTVFSGPARLLKYPAEMLDRIIPGREGAGGYRQTELNILMELAREEGFIGGEADIASAIMELDSRNCSSAMVPREEVVYFMSDWSPERITEEAGRTVHTVYPVVDAEGGGVKGVADVRDILGRGEYILREMPFFPESARLSRVLDTLRSRRVRLGAVIDEYGDWAGIISVSDILARAIFAGTPALSLPDGVTRKDGALIIPGNLPVEVLATIMRSAGLEARYAESCGGLLQEITGRIPRKGEVIRYDEFVFRVLETEGNAVRKIRVEYGADQ